MVTEKQWTKFDWLAKASSTVSGTEEILCQIGALLLDRNEMLANAAGPAAAAGVPSGHLFLLLGLMVAQRGAGGAEDRTRRVAAACEDLVAVTAYLKAMEDRGDA